MTATVPYAGPAGPQDGTNNVLIWIRLLGTVPCGAGMLWATKTTCQQE